MCRWPSRWSRSSISTGPRSGSRACRTTRRSRTRPSGRRSHMANYGYFDHNDPAPPVARDPFTRMTDCGYSAGGAAGREHRLRPDRRQRRHERLARLAWSQGRTSSSPSFRSIGVGVAIGRQRPDLLGAGLRRWSELGRAARVRAAAGARATCAGAASARCAPRGTGCAACGDQAARLAGCSHLVTCRRLRRAPARRPRRQGRPRPTDIGSAILAPVSKQVAIRDARRHKARSTRLVVAKPHAGTGLRRAHGIRSGARRHRESRGPLPREARGQAHAGQGRDRRSRRHLHLGDPGRRRRQAPQGHRQGHRAPRHLARAPREADRRR